MNDDRKLLGHEEPGSDTSEKPEMAPIAIAGQNGVATNNLVLGTLLPARCSALSPQYLSLSTLKLGWLFPPITLLAFPVPSLTRLLSPRLASNHESSSSTFLP